MYGSLSRSFRYIGTSHSCGGRHDMGSWHCLYVVWLVVSLGYLLYVVCNDRYRD